MTRTTMIQTASGDWIHPWDLVRRRWAAPTRRVPGDGAVIFESWFNESLRLSPRVKQPTPT
jgi:hypothetical protein